MEMDQVQMGTQGQGVCGQPDSGVQAGTAATCGFCDPSKNPCLRALLGLQQYFTKHDQPDSWVAMRCVPEFGNMLGAGDNGIQFYGQCSQDCPAALTSPQQVFGFCADHYKRVLAMSNLLDAADLSCLLNKDNLLMPSLIQLLSLVPAGHRLLKGTFVDGIHPTDRINLRLRGTSNPTIGGMPTRRFRRPTGCAQFDLLPEDYCNNAWALQMLRQLKQSTATDYLAEAEIWQKLRPGDLAEATISPEARMQARLLGVKFQVLHSGGQLVVAEVRYLLLYRAPAELLLPWPR